MAEPAKKTDVQAKVMPLASVPMGLTLKGLIMEKHSSTTSKGDPQYHVSIAVKGIEKQVRVKTTEDFFLSCVEMTPYTHTVTFQEFNGRVYWQESDL